MITLGSVYQEHGQIEDDDGSKALPVHPEVLRKSFLFREDWNGEDSKTEEYWNKTQKKYFSRNKLRKDFMSYNVDKKYESECIMVKMIAGSINLRPHLACSQGAVVWVRRRPREQRVVAQGRGWLGHPALEELENMYFCLDGTLICHEAFYSQCSLEES